MACMSPLKRPLESGDPISTDSPVSPTTPGPFDKETITLNTSQNTSPLSPLSSIRHISPSPSLQDPSSTALPSNPSTAMGASQPPSKKRKKLTTAEKQEKEQEKLRKEAEKKVKEEEKKLKQAQAEEARKIKAEKEEEKRKAREIEKAKKDEIKRQKEAEKQAKEGEKLKKERAQSRISSFFTTKPSTGATSHNSSRRNSVSSTSGALSVAGSPSKPKISSVFISDYEKTFPPFFVHAHTTLAPVTNHSFDLLGSVDAFEKDLKVIATAGHTAEALASFRQETLATFRKGLKRRKLNIDQPVVKNLVSRIEGSSAANPMDLTSSSTSTVEPLEVLRSLPIKYLKYREDVRPPWIGTYTKRPKSKAEFVRLCRNPFTRVLPEVNYDYDSEAEWEEPGEGEELGPGSEDEDDAEEDEGDMEGFLDDEDAEGVPKRKQLLGDMEPMYTSIHWESSETQGQNKVLAYGSCSIDLASFRMDTLLADQSFPIDPFSTSYWPSPEKQTSPKKAGNQTTLKIAPPNRTPLLALQGPNQLASSTQTKQSSTTKNSKASTAKPLATELMADFKAAVDGSDLTKLGLVEVLKKKFPSATKGTVESTLLQIAVREGAKPTEKRWRLIDP